MIHILDLQFFSDETIAAFIVETSEGPVLIEAGPYSVYKNLVRALKDRGYVPEDIKHVLLSHIHFDHAGAAWALAETGAKIYVHPFGYKHLLNPERLYNSAKRIYGDMMETLWGGMFPIPESKLVAVENNASITIGDKTFQALHTPGHASHHIAWKVGKNIFTGDVGGCKIGNGPVVPPCPPPDIDIGLWFDSLDIIQAQGPERLYLTHYGIVENISIHFHELRHMLNEWGDWVRVSMERGETAEEMTPKFRQYVENQLLETGINDQMVARYEAANPSWMSVTGLMRYWSGTHSPRL
ncbi:MAG: MBL fold metallo-hydrolase [Bacteroidia bacterium]|nr:MBL fold metallo-hydrolase [Bacteroidia bacterium]